MKTIVSIISLFFFVVLNAQETPVTFDQLPAEAKTFIKDNFKSPFHHAIKDVESRSISYEAVLEDNTEIEFTEAGRWVEVDAKGKPVPPSFIQRSIVDYVKINYPTQAITKIERSDTGYKARVTSGTDLKFDARGTFVKID
jgi:hypothetical protein